MLSIRWSDYDPSWVSLKAKNLPPLAHLIDCICPVPHTHMIYVLCLQDCVSTWVKNKLSHIHNKTFANLHSDATEDLKCLYDQILDTHFFFYIFVHNSSFLDFLPNFNLLQTYIRSHVSLDLFREFATANNFNFPCSKSCIKNNKNFGSYIRAIFYINCYYNFNPCGIFEKVTSFSQILNQDLEQGKLMVAVNSRK